MVLAHGVMDSHKMLIFHMFYGDSMALFRFFRFQRRQGNTAATDDGAAYGVDYVAADASDGCVFVNGMNSVLHLFSFLSECAEKAQVDYIAFYYSTLF